MSDDENREMTTTRNRSHARPSCVAKRTTPLAGCDVEHCQRMHD